MYLGEFKFFIFFFLTDTKIEVKQRYIFYLFCIICVNFFGRIFFIFLLYFSLYFHPVFSRFFFLFLFIFKSLVNTKNFHNLVMLYLRKIVKEQCFLPCVHIKIIILTNKFNLIISNKY